MRGAACAEIRIGDRLEATGPEHHPAQVPLFRHFLLRDARAARQHVAPRPVVENLFANHGSKFVLAVYDPVTTSGWFRIAGRHKAKTYREPEWGRPGVVSSSARDQAPTAKARAFARAFDVPETA